MKQSLLKTLWQKEKLLFLSYRNTSICEHMLERVKNRLLHMVIVVLDITPFSTIFQSCNGGQFIYPRASPLSYRRTPHYSLCKQLASFPRRLLSHWWKTNYACPSVFCQTSDIMLAVLGFELTTQGLKARVATDWPNGSRSVTLDRPVQFYKVMFAVSHINLSLHSWHVLCVQVYLTLQTSHIWKLLMVSFYGA